PEEWIFRDKDDLQMKLERFITRPRERKDLIRENQEKIQERWTYEAFARDLLARITRDLAAI
ncbi:MAG TPA: glycosyltransferase family 1 protein, partial [Phycisphaeraceae bacterium]|nr:glycosyltransferase family 1 protein [Phycisphaeraceae bacterium]